MDTSFLSSRIEAYRAGELSLPALLFDELGGRGTVSAQLHAAELERLAHLRAEGTVETGVLQLIADRLGALQVVAAVEEGGAATIVKAAPRIAAVAGDAQDDEEVTRVLPLDRADAEAPVADPADQVTMIKPARASENLASPTQTHGTRSADTSGWQRVAEAGAGEHASVGSVLKGRFVLEREIGRGGMGVVFLARDERKVEARDRDPYVAVKVLNDEFRRHPDSLIALQRESRRSQSLAHDNIVRVYDFDKDGTIVFMTMEYVDGSDLKSMIRERAFNGLPPAQARPLIEGMARALKRAHDAGVVHSDFKPGNVMVTRDGVPKVFDFGIARAGKQPGDTSDDQTVFDAGKLGALTPAYASLEMIEGKPPQPTDDIYALGCVAFELLTGKHPFDRASAEVALRERRRPPVVRGLSKRQNRALCDAVAFTADRRLKSADQLVEGLRNISLRQRIGRPVAYALAAGVLLLAGGWFLMGQLRDRRVAQVASRFQSGDPHRYADETQAVAALAALDDNERRQLMLERGDAVQQFLLDRVGTYWNPVDGRRDYAAALRVFDVPQQLHLFLPRLDLRRIAVEKEKHDLDQPKVATAVRTAAPATASSVGDRALPAATLQATTVAPAAGQTPAKQQPAPSHADSSPPRMQQVTAGLLREGERNFAQQNYSAAIANARAALQVSPGDTAAKRLLHRAQQAQQQAMSSISIN